MISRSRFSLVSSGDGRTSERADSGEPGEESGLAEVSAEDGYDRKSLPRRNWLYKIGSAPGSYTCLLRMQTSSPNAREPHESAPRLDAPTRTVSTDTRPCSRFPPRYLPFCLSSLMHKHVARRSRVTESTRNWETPSFHEKASCDQVSFLSLFLSLSRYEST